MDELVFGLIKIRQKSFQTLALTAVVAIWTTTQANADIVLLTGSVSEIAPPASVGNNSFTSDANMFVFFESTLTLPSNLVVDTSNIAPDTRLSSYFLHGDEISDAGVNFTGSITFSSDIIGVASTPGILASTEAAPFDFRSPTTDYSSVVGGRGFEGFDSFTVSADLRTLSFDTTVAGGQDQLRVLTAAVPEPSSLVILLPVFGLGLLFRRRLVRRFQPEVKPVSQPSR